MKNELTKINPVDFGLEEPKANELTGGLSIPLSERVLLIKEFKTLENAEIVKENIPRFKTLRLKIAKNRTGGINKWHTEAKNYFLKGGQFVDAIKRKEILINKQMEEKLFEAETHFETLEKQRIEKLQQERVEKLSKYVEDAHVRDLAKFEDDEFEALFEMKKKEYEERAAAEKKVEEDRVAKEKAEALERERIRLENEQLRADAAKVKQEQEAAEAKRKRLLKIEADKLEAQRKAKDKIIAEARAKAEAAEAELKKQADAAALKIKQEQEAAEAELKKGDKQKISDLIAALETLKTSFEFKSKTNRLLYKNVCGLINKVIIYIKKQ